MNELIFHVREENNKAVTFAVKKGDSYAGSTEYEVGYSVTHENDQFNKKTGRRIATERLKSLTRNKKNNATSIAHSCLVDYVPHRVKKNLENVLRRASKITKDEETQKINYKMWGFGKTKCLISGQFMK